jgi:hypothetical protein
LSDQSARRFWPMLDLPVVGWLIVPVACLDVRLRLHRVSVRDGRAEIGLPEEVRRAA